MNTNFSISNNTPPRTINLNTDTFTPHSFDSRNLVRHAIETGTKCNALPDNSKLYIIKSKKLANNPAAAGQWNDQHVFETLNSYSMFKSSVEKYRQKLVTSMVEQPMGFVKLMKEQSK